MSVKEQFAHIVLSDGKNYKDYIIADNTLLSYEFMEKDKFRIKGGAYYEGIVLCRGKNKKECRRLAKENRKAIPIHRFCPFPSPENSVVLTSELGNVEKQSPRQTPKIPQRLESGPSAPKNKEVVLSELKSLLRPEISKIENSVTNQDLENEKFATANKIIEISHKPEKSKIEKVTKIGDADDKTGESANYPQFEFPKFKKNIANTYCTIEGITSQQTKILEENAGHKQAEFSVPSKNQSNKTVDSNSEMIVETPIAIKNKANLQSLIESDIEEIDNVNEAVNTCYPSHAFLYGGKQHEYYGNLLNKEKMSKTHNLKFMNNERASSPLSAYFESSFSKEKKFSAKIGSPRYMQEYNALFKKYKKLGKQYEKLKNTNFSLQQYVKNAIDDCENVLMQSNILTLPFDYSGNSLK